jgi:hypothetical protein
LLKLRLCVCRFGIRVASASSTERNTYRQKYRYQVRYYKRSQNSPEHTPIEIPHKHPPLDRSHLITKERASIPPGLVTEIPSALTLLPKLLDCGLSIAWRMIYSDKVAVLFERTPATAAAPASARVQAN